MNGRENLLVFRFVPFEFHDVDCVKSVVYARNHLFELLDFALQLTYFFGHFLCVVGVVPKSVGILYRFEFFDSVADFYGIYAFVSAHHFHAHFF